jgi:hypothetical protein
VAFLLREVRKPQRLSPPNDDYVVHAMACQFLNHRACRRFDREGEIMKKFFSVVAAGCLLSLLVVGSARAQLPGTEIRVQIPFDFTVKGKTLPAGQYEIRRINDEPIGLLIRNMHDKHDNVVFETEPKIDRSITKRDELIFTRYGDSYFLSEVVTAGEQTGEEVNPSHRERELRREMMSRNQAQPETVTVAALN